MLGIFSPKGTIVGDGHFWGRAPAEKLGCAALGFVAKGPTWFPRADMAAALAAAAPIAAAHGATLAIGSSMGGYAALKYGRALGAPIGLAYCPNATVPMRDRVLREDYRGEVPRRDVAVMADEVPDVAMCIYDPGVDFDAREVDELAAVAPWLRRVTVPNVGHEVIRPFAATEVFGAVVDLARHGDVEGLRRLAQVRRRLPGQRTLSLVRHSILRRPMLAYHLLLREIAHFPPRDAREIALALGRHFLRHASPGKARTVFRAGMDRLPGDGELRAAWEEAGAVLAGPPAA